MKNTIAFFDAKPYDRQFFDEANRNKGFEIKYFSPHLNRDTVELARGSEVVCAFVNDVLDKDTINVLEKNGTRLIAMRCAGYNNVDLKAAFGHIHVVRVPAYSPHAVAEYAAALILSLNRKIYRSYNRVRDGNFTLNGLLGFDLYSKTAGIIGTGRIGRCMVTILKGFGMKILVYDAYPDEAYARKEGLRYVDLATLCKAADIISLHCPLTPQTRHLINEETIAGMKDGVTLINTSRGELVDTHALIEALKKGKIGAAGLDVYEEESEYFFEDFSASGINDDMLARLMTFPNVLITAHQGFFTFEAMHNITQTTLQNIRDYFSGGLLANEICYRCGTQDCAKKQNKRCF
jgi:D-lactate dehydrogenase